MKFRYNVNEYCIWWSNVKCFSIMNIMNAKYALDPEILISNKISPKGCPSIILTSGQVNPDVTQSNSITCNQEAFS